MGSPLAEQSLSTVAIVPCKNGAASVGITVRTLLNEDAVGRVIVVDDGSTDKTSDAALAAGATVVRLPCNQGKGAALQAGVDAAPEADRFLLVDADTKETAHETIHLLGPLARGEAQLVIGVLPSAGSKAGLGTVKKVAAKGIERACGFVARAPLSGQRAIDANLMRSLSMAPRFGCEVGMTIDAVRLGATVMERDVAMDHHHTGRTLSGFLHRARQGVDVVRALFPRLISPAVRHGALVVVTTFLLGLILSASERSNEMEGDLLPHAAPVQVVVVPGWSWSDVSRNGDKISAFPGLDNILDPSQPMLVGSVATGKVEDITRAVAQGSRDDDKNEETNVKVAVRPKGITKSESFPAARIVVGLTVEGQDKELRPIIVQGLASTGELVSNSTRHNGIVDLTDIAPTAQWIETRTSSAELAEPLRVRQNTNAVSEAVTTTHTVKFYDQRQPAFILVFVLLQTALYLYAYARKDRIGGPSVSIIAALFIAATPLAAWITQLALGNYGVPSSVAWSACFAVSLAIIVGMSRYAARGVTVSLRRILLATITLISLSALTGNSMQFGGFFGSSPALGARYYGLGNVASALLLFATVLWAALVIRSATERGPEARNAAWWRTLAVAAIVTAITGTPGLGSDVGGLIADVVVFGAFFTYARAGNLKLSRVIAICATAVAALAIAAIVDAQRAAADRTHLGRLVHEGPSALASTIADKVHANLLGYGFPWTLIVIAIAASILVGLLRGNWRATLPIGSIERSGAIAALAGSGVAYGVNDSGIVILVLVAVLIGPFLMVCHRQNRWDIPQVIPNPGTYNKVEGVTP